MKNIGIIYVATGKKYLAECIRSAMSAKKVMPDISISLWTDVKTISDKHSFDFINIIDNPKYNYFDKISPLLETQYEKTLFVDTDTYFIESVYEIYTLLDRFELAYAHAPCRFSRFGKRFIGEIPMCFPEANTGVIAYRKNESVMQLIQEWKLIYTKQLEALEAEEMKIPDQPAFREALYSSEVRSIVIPPEYNIRTIFPVFKGAGYKVKILHGREPTLSRAIGIINARDDIETFDFRKHVVLKQILRKMKMAIAIALKKLLSKNPTTA